MAAMLDFAPSRGSAVSNTAARSGPPAGQPRCAKCGAWGKDLVRANGLCGHCSRLREASAVDGPDAGAGPRVGQKRPFSAVAPSSRPEDEMSSGAAGVGAATGAAGLSESDIARLVAEAERTEVPALDASGVKKLVLGLERAITRNSLARAKFPGEPARFLDSEVALDEELKRARLLAAAPELYPTLLSSGGMKSLLELLAHENSDIAIDVLVLLGELCDPDVLVGETDAGADADDDDDDEEAGAGAGGSGSSKSARRAARSAGLSALVSSLQDAGGLALIVGTLLRLEGSMASAAAAAGASSGGDAAAAVAASDDDAQGMYHALQLLASLVEADPGVATAACSVTAAGAGSGSASRAGAGAGSGSGTSSLLGVLLRRVRGKEFDANKGAAAELLSVLLAADPPNNGARLGEGRFSTAAAAPGSSGAGSSELVEGMEALLAALAVYKRRAPAGADEEECAANLFDAVCSALVRSTQERAASCYHLAAYSRVSRLLYTGRRLLPLLYLLLSRPSFLHPLSAYPFLTFVALQVLPANQSRFAAVEGIELMLRLVREAGHARYGALKVLAFAVADCPPNAAALVDAGGLKDVFPAFLGRGLAHTRKLHGGDAARDEEEQVIAIVAACAALLPLPGLPLGAAAAEVAGMQFLRFVAKFSESRFEKLDRLVELRRERAARVHAALGRRLAEEAEEDADEDVEDQASGNEARRAARSELRIEMRYMARVDGGLPALQRLDATLARLASAATEAAALDAAVASGEVTLAAGAPAVASYLPLLQEVAFMARAKLYEAGGAGAAGAAGGAGTAAALPISLSLSLTGISEVLSEYAERLEAEAAPGTSAGSADGVSAPKVAGLSGAAAAATADLARTRAAISAEHVRRLLERLSVAAGWTGPGAVAHSTADDSALAQAAGARTSEGAGMDLA